MFVFDYQSLGDGRSPQSLARADMLTFKAAVTLFRPTTKVLTPFVF
jgi:hypothetical protein